MHPVQYQAKLDLVLVKRVDLGWRLRLIESIGGQMASLPLFVHQFEQTFQFSRIWIKSTGFK